MPPVKHTPKKSRGKLKPQMLKLPKYEKIGGKRRELSNAEKGMIIAFFAIYGVISTVSLIIGRPWSTVKNFLHRYCKRGTMDNLPRSGRPEVLTRRDKRAILRAVRKNRQFTREQIRRIHAPHVSLATIDRLLRQHNIRKWLAKERPKLTEEHAKARLEWALAHKDWTAEDFQRVIYSDECSVEVGPTGHQRWVFRTPQEKWNLTCILPKKRRQVKLMVWGCFWGNQRGPLVPLTNGSVTARVYRELLRRWLIPVLEDVQTALGSPLFQQDNARIHTAKIMLAFFKRYAIPLESHPPYSPDLNPIEHAWVLLKRQLIADYPFIGDYPGAPEKVKAKLAEVLPLCWEKIPQKQFEVLWKSMPDRVQAVIDAKGWYTRY
jgi:transposase